MARKRNDLKTVQITLSTTEPIEQYLQQLVATGLYGKNQAEAAERLVSTSIQRLVKDGDLRAKKRRS
jgi:hypothetical protein